MNNVGQGVEYQAVTAPAKFPWLAVGAAVAAVVIIVLVVTLPIVLLSSSTSSSGSSSSSSSSSSSGPFDGVKQYFVIQVGSGLAITCSMYYPVAKLTLCRRSDNMGSGPRSSYNW